MTSPINQFRTRFLQKLGKAERSERPSEYDLSRENFIKLEKHVDKAVKVTKTFSQKGESASRAQTELGEFFVESGLQDKAEVGEAMVRIGESLKSLSMIHHAMLVNVVEKFVRPGIDFHEEFNAGTKLHKKYNKRTLEFDTQKRTISQLKNKKEPDQQKIASAVEDLSRIEDARNDAFIEAEYEAQRMEHKAKTDYILYMCDMFYSFHNYFAECYTMSTELKEYVDKVKDNASDLKGRTVEKKAAPEKVVRASMSNLHTASAAPPPPVSERPRSSYGDSVPVSVNTISASGAPPAKITGGDSSISMPTFIGKSPGSAIKSSGGIGQCTALYDYEAQDKTELSMREGDVITVVSTSDDGWFMGDLNGQKGLFPSSYCTDIGASAPTSQAPAPPGASGDGGGSRTVIALYDYEAEEADELSFVEGDRITVIEETDSGWWVGEVNGKQGTFPSNYTEAG